MERDDHAPLRLLTAVSSLAAAGIHFAVSPAHFEEYWLFGWFFVVAASLQALWSVGMAILVSRPLTIAGGVGNGMLIAIWAWTRAVEVPIGPAAGDTEPVGAVSVAAVAFEAIIVALAILLVSGRHWPILRAARLGTVAAAAVVMFAVVGIVLAAGGNEHLGAEETGHGHSHGGTP